MAVGFEIGNKLYKAGLIPDNTKRIVIDIQVNSIAVVYYETFVSKQTLDVTIESLLKNKDEIKIVPIE